MDIDAWLRELKLSQYAAPFRDRGVDGTALERLSDADLKTMGVAPRHRKQLIAAIAALNPLLEEGAPAAPGGAAQALGLQTQHRNMTVLFCDLVGSTSLSMRLDPEDLRAVVGAFHRACADGVTAAGGYVAQYVGDGLMAFFGYPEAHEDDAERSILAALNIAMAVPKLKTQQGEALAVRVGVATGPVVVGDLRRTGAVEERAVIGETPNLAARLQAAAEPNHIVIADSTHRRTSALFEFQALPPLTLKGVAAPQTAWSVVGEAASTGRSSRRGQSCAQPSLCGRDTELGQVLALWRQHKAGDHQIIGLTGEPGIGKSRLVSEFRARIAQEPHIWLESGAAQVFRSRPLFPIARMVRRSLSGGRRLSADAYVEALTQSLRNAGLDVGAAVPLIAELIGVATPDYSAPLTTSIDQRRAALSETLQAWVSGIARRSPTVMVVEDLHWADASTLEFLRAFMRAGGADQPLLLYTSREADALPPAKSHTQIAVAALDDASLRAIVAGAAASAPSGAFMDGVVARAQGVPLYAVELALLLDKSGASDAAPIPESLSDLLAERLDRLGAAREVAQVAAVLGDDFWFRLLHQVVGGDARQLRSTLSKLTKTGVLVTNGEGVDTRYLFRHALLRDAAYGALLRSQRRELHRRIATVLSSDYPQLATSRPQLMAQHWTGAGETALAVAAWKAGGDHARRTRALSEAEDAYRQALQVLETLPSSDERDAQELALQSALSSIYHVTKGYSAPETEVVAARAHALAEARGEIAALVAQEIGAFAVQSSAGDYQLAAGTAERVMEFARADGRPSVLAHGYMIQMTSRYRLGDLDGAEESFGEGSVFFDTPGFSRQPGAFAQTFGNAARVAWMREDSTAADLRIARALANADATENAYDAAFARYMAAILRVLTAEFEAARAYAEQSIALSEQHGFPQFAAISRIALGRAQASLGDAAGGEVLIRQGIDAMTLTRSRVAMTMYLAWLAQARALGGDATGALATLDEALRVNAQEMFFRPEILRLRGELLGASANGADAARDLREAVALAKRMGAKLFHARALAALQALG